MLKFKKIKGNYVHKTAVINWKKIKIDKGNIIGPYVAFANLNFFPIYYSSFMNIVTFYFFKF
jgi:hypothetical protein